MQPQLYPLTHPPIPVSVKSTLLSGLVAYWQFDGKRTIDGDAAGLYYANQFQHGTSLPNATGGVSTSLASGAAFNTGVNGGNGQFLASPSGATSWAQNFLPPAGTSFTVCGWVNLGDATADHRIMSLGIASAAGTAGSLAWDFLRQQSGGRYKLQLFGDINATVVPLAATTTNSATGTNTWSFVVAWIDGSASQVFIQLNNGTVVSGSATSGVFQTTGPLVIGGVQQPGAVPTGRMTGYLTGLGYWSRVLTAAERTALYAGGAGASWPFTGL